MTLKEAREIVLEAGLKLVKEGLVARTWGNISCRVDENSFVITPSGRTYEELTETDIVLVNIEDLTHEGNIKPSSEKGLHAEAYKQRADVTAVIHTHQMNASTCAAARKEVPATDAEFKEVLGESVRCAAYALPGTKKLKMATAEALKGRNAALMANHGAVCVGKTMEDAFKVALTLESKCADFIASEFKKSSGKNDSSLETMYDYYVTSKGGSK